MSVSIIEVLQNANFNMDNLIKLPMLLPLVKEQLNNAIILLEKGYALHDDFDQIIEEFGSVDNAPDTTPINQ